MTTDRKRVAAATTVYFVVDMQKEPVVVRWTEVRNGDMSFQTVVEYCRELEVEENNYCTEEYFNISFYDDKISFG